MDDVAALTPASDFSRFVATGVDRGVSNAAMRKLFADPRFNVMDGLDTYIDDYGKADPIPESMLRQMNQSKLLRLFADDERSATAAPAATACTDGEGGDPVAESGRVRACESLDDGSIAVAAAPPATDPTPAAPLVPARAPDDDPDLRLQQDDAAGCAGAAPGARG